MECTCCGAGNGMKWFNMDCPIHGPRSRPTSEKSPMPKEFEEKLKEAFKKFKEPADNG